MCPSEYRELLTSKRQLPCLFLGLLAHRHVKEPSHYHQTNQSRPNHRDGIVVSYSHKTIERRIRFEDSLKIRYSDDWGLGEGSRVMQAQMVEAGSAYVRDRRMRDFSGSFAPLEIARHDPLGFGQTLGGGRCADRANRARERSLPTAGKDPRPRTGYGDRRDRGDR